jgi:hypothetical protein
MQVLYVIPHCFQRHSFGSIYCTLAWIIVLQQQDRTRVSNHVPVLEQSDDQRCISSFDC